jgi:hypothetical protein
MPTAPHWLIKQSIEHLSRASDIDNIPKNVQGIYVLLERRRTRPKARKEVFKVVYVGMSRGKKLGIGNRLKGHNKSKRKGPHWTHFSIFEVHDNIAEQQIAGLEALFRHIYRRDPAANRLNKQRGSDQLRKVRKSSFEHWA